MPRIYNVRKTLDGRLDAADVAHVDQFRPEGSNHRPRTEARLVHDGELLFGRFDVWDQYVRSVQTGFNQPVCRDSCVEIFLQPDERGYFNFEFNAGGALLASYIRDPTRTREGFKDYSMLPEAELRRIELQHSLPKRVEPEISEPTTWRVSFVIPLAILEIFCGPLRPLAGQNWRGNFYKCGDETSHPHWAAWAPIGARNFHLPESFGHFVFEA